MTTFTTTPSVAYRLSTALYANLIDDAPFVSEDPEDDEMLIHRHAAGLDWLLEHYPGRLYVFRGAILNERHGFYIWLDPAMVSPPGLVMSLEDFLAREYKYGITEEPCPPTPSS